VKGLDEYDSFIEGKTRQAESHGFDASPFTAPLFDWQAHVVRWAVKQGRCALFEDCGLGKTIQQIEWAHQVVMETGLPVLILTPLAVAHQTAHEAERFGITAQVVESAADISGAGIWITNYEKLERFDGVEFAGVVFLIKDPPGRASRII
jgi:hypothetical protein